MISASAFEPWAAGIAGRALSPCARPAHFATIPAAAGLPSRGAGRVLVRFGRLLARPAFTFEERKWPTANSPTTSLRNCSRSSPMDARLWKSAATRGCRQLAPSNAGPTPTMSSAGGYSRPGRSGSCSRPTDLWRKCVPVKTLRRRVTCSMRPAGGSASSATPSATSQSPSEPS